MQQTLDVNPLLWSFDKSSFQLYTNNGQRKVKESLKLGHNCLRKLTIDYKEFLKNIDPDLHVFRPIRVLTKPYTPSGNGGQDNKEKDLIVRVNDVLVNSNRNLEYQVQEFLGKGTFGQVFKCTLNGETLAVKIIKNDPCYNYQCAKEIKILRSFQQWGECKSIIKILDQFMYKNHVCLVFPQMSYSIYDYLKYQGFFGQSISLVRNWLKQIIEGLAQTEFYNVIHADLKPENIMIKENKEKFANSEVKIIDFGSSMMGNEKVFQSYIQSRFYRAPEVLLRFAQYTTRIDIWSLGCIAVELVCGIALFPCRDEGECVERIVSVILESKEIDAEYVRRGQNWQSYFEEGGSGKMRLKGQFQINNHPIQSLGDIEKYYNEEQESSQPCFATFLSFVKDCLALEPEKRKSANELLEHRFITNKNDPLSHSSDDILQLCKTDGDEQPHEKNLDDDDFELDQVRNLLSDDESPSQFG